jgi:ppGpp synthetase/RelA/SpoT-type nucleotidyltranferase
MIITNNKFFFSVFYFSISKTKPLTNNSKYNIFQIKNTLKNVLTNAYMILHLVIEYNSNDKHDYVHQTL